jgi:hypothetical protein
MKSKQLVWSIAVAGGVLLPSLGLSADNLYSDLSDKACKVVSRGEENYMVDQECPGVLGYKLQKNTEDDRDSLTIIEGNRSQSLNFYGHVTSSLNYLGDKAEWRIKMENLLL